MGFLDKVVDPFNILGTKDKVSVPKSVDPLEVATKGKNKGTSLAGRQATSLFGNYYPSVFPQVLGLQEKYTPQFMEQAFKFGGQGVTGFQALQEMASGRAAQSMADLRAKELGLMTGQTGDVRGLMESLSPEQAAAIAQANRTASQAQGLESDFMGRAGGMMGQYGSQVGEYGSTLGDISGYAGTTISDAQSQELASGILGGVNPYVSETISGANADVSRANQMAQEAFQRRGALSPEEERAAQQQARESFSASGRLGGNAAVAAEIQNREAAKAARRGEAAQLGQQAFSQQLGAAGQQMAAEQALYGQRGSNIERDIQLQQTRSNQALNAAQQRLATQQARYGQLGSEQERELARRQNLFSQGIAGGSQRSQERQLGFSQLMDVESQRARLREEAAQAGQRSYGMAGGFYTQPGLELLRQTPASYGAGSNLAGIGMEYGQTLGPQLDYNMPLNFAQQRAGALDAQNMAQFQADQQRKAQMFGLIKNVGAVAAAPFTGGASLAMMG